MLLIVGVVAVLIAVVLIPRVRSPGSDTAAHSGRWRLACRRKASRDASDHTALINLRTGDGILG